MKEEKKSIWKASVRNYEIDYQGIVNNANYFHYFDQARADYFQQIFGINIDICANHNLNIVLIKTEVLFKFSLKFADSFYVSSEMERISRFKFKFIQQLYLDEHERLAAESQSIIATISREGKPQFVEEFSAMIWKS